MKLTKKFLLASAAVLAFHNFAQAEESADKKDKSGARPLSLKINGNMTALAMGGSQDVELNGKAGTVTFQVPTSEFNFIVAGQTSGGINYGYTTRLKAISESMSISRSYAEFSHDDLGIFQIGNVKGADDTMCEYGAYNLQGGTGGALNGSATGIFNVSDGTIFGTTIIGSPGVATKINYYTPEFYGFKAGISFTPDTSHRGKQNRDNTRVTTKGDDGNEYIYYPNDDRYGWGINNFTMALSYDRDINQDVKLHVDFATIREQGRYVFLDITNLGGGTAAGNRTPHTLKSTQSYMISARLSVKDWDLAASYLDNRNSRMITPEIENYMKNGDINMVNADNSQTPTKTKSYHYFPVNTTPNQYWLSNGTAGKAWNVGARYTFGAYQAALGYFETNRRTDEMNNKASVKAISATLDFKAIEGVVFFTEVVALKTKTNIGIVDNTNVNGNGKAAMNQYQLERKAGTDASYPDNKGVVIMMGTKISF